jgi:xylulokinase
MAAHYLIGVDLGTSVVKAGLYCPDGRLIAQASRPAPLRQPEPGIAEQDGEEFVAAAAASVHEAVSRAGAAATHIAGVAFDGQMGGAMAVDSSFRALTPWYPSGLDGRYLSHQQQLAERAGDHLIEMCGDLPIMAPRMLWWREESPELYRRIAKVVTLAGYVAGRLTGLRAEQAFIDPSYLTWVGLGDTAGRRWSSELAEVSGLGGGGLDRMPRIVPATEVVGYLTGEAAAACGLPEGLPVAAGAGDQAAGFVGAGLVDDGQLIDVAGTFPVFGVCSPRYFADLDTRMLKPIASPLGDGAWYSMMYINGGGLTHRWFAEQFAPPRDDSGTAGNGAPFPELDAAAERVTPGADGLLCVPHLMGRACPNEPDTRGAWLGFTWTHGRAHFYRALLESVAYEYALACRALRTAAPDTVLGEVRVIGGGAASGLWNRIKADVLGLPYVRLALPDAATLGGAIVAGHATGLIPDMASVARRAARPGERYLPDTAAHDRYRACVNAYGRVLGELGGAYAALAEHRSRSADGRDAQTKHV